MQIGKIDFNEKLKSLSWFNFKKIYDDGGYAGKTGVTAEESAQRLGIKIPVKKSK